MRWKQGESKEREYSDKRRVGGIGEREVADNILLRELDKGLPTVLSMFMTSSLMASFFASFATKLIQSKGAMLDLPGRLTCWSLFSR